MTTELVSLFACKKCSARMFEKDCRSHLIRCSGIVFDKARDVLKFFTKGEPTQHARPGGNWKPMHQPTKGRRPGKRKEHTEDDESDEALDVE